MQRGKIVTEKPWKQPMPEEQFAIMRDILAAPSPVGLEAAMTFGVLIPYFEKWMRAGWKIHTFRGNAGIVLDTAPDRDDLLTVLFVGHADKIRMQVRQIGKDGKIWLDTDSFLPTTLIGHEVLLFSEDPKNPGHYRTIKGGTVEAIGAIHFANEALRSGKSGIKKEQIYLELQIHSENKQKQIEALGVRVGDNVLLDRPIKRGFSPETFYGAYLDNGLGCFATAEIARLVAQAGGLKNIRALFGIATHEEIGRMGSRVMAAVTKPDILIGVDVNHDYVAAPGIESERMPPLAMGQGFTLSVGAIASEKLNALIQQVALEHEIPIQRSVVGRDTGTDAMAGVLASIDCAATSVGFPIRNMHTISEAGHTGDLLASIYAMFYLLQSMDQAEDGQGLSQHAFHRGHPRLDTAPALTHLSPANNAANNKSSDDSNAS
ncbi:M28 family peptidase [Myxococcota bacterium]|nr:M28 family peptidase [Myxococcota bacterium]